MVETIFMKFYLIYSDLSMRYSYYPKCAYKLYTKTVMSSAHMCGVTF